MAQQSERIDQSQLEEQAFSLRSDFARRASSRPDVPGGTSCNVTVQAKISTESGHEEADMTETLRVIDSARRFLNNNQSGRDEEVCQQTFTNMTGSDKGKSHRIFLRDMSKETLKKTGSSLDVLEEAEDAENINDITQEAFKDEMADITACLKSNQSQLLSFLKDEEQNIGLTEARLGKRHVSAIEIDPRKTEQAEVIIEDYETTSADRLDAQNRDRLNTGYPRHTTSQSMAQAPQMSNDTFIRIEQNTSGILQKSMIPEKHTLRQMTPILPDREATLQNDSMAVTQQDMSSDISSDMLLEQQIRETQYEPKLHETAQMRSTNKRHVSGGNSMSPSALDADFAELQASRLEGNGEGDNDANEVLDCERSHMYETGEQSDAIRSIRSKACETPPNDKDVTHETETIDKTQLQTTAQQISSTKPTTSPKQIMNQSSIDCSNVKILQKEPAKTEQSESFKLGSSSRLEERHLHQFDLKSDSPARPKTITQQQESSARQDDVKHQISLKYDQMELERKLAEMCKTIGDFQKAYDHQEPSSRAATALSQRSQKSAKSSRLSRSPPRQIKPRKATPRNSKVAAKKSSDAMKRAIEQHLGGADPMSSEAEQTMVNSECDSSALVVEEQTFRPGRRHDLPLQCDKKKKSSHANLIREKGFYEQRNERREQEYREVMDKRDKQPYKDYVKDLEERSRENLRKARTRNPQGSAKRHAHFSQPPPSRPQRSPTQEREESLAPKPEALPQLLAHADSSKFDGRYFTAMSKQTMSPTADSAALFSSRSRQDAHGNLISCLRSGRRNPNAQGSTERETETYFSPREGRGGPRAQEHSGQASHMVNSQQPSTRLRRPHSYTLGPDTLESSAYRSEKTNQNFKEIMSPSSISNRQDPRQSSPRTSMAHLLRDTTGQCPNNSKFDQQHNSSNQLLSEDPQQNIEMEQRKNSRARNFRNIDGFEVVQKIQQQMLHHSRSGAPLSTDHRYGAGGTMRQAHQPGGSVVTNQVPSGPMHSTHRSMGIESYCQKKEQAQPKPPQPYKMNSAATPKHQGENHNSDQPVFTAMEQIQSKSEKLCQQLTQARRNRQEIEDNKTELLALKGENHNLKKAIEQKDLALCSLREQNGEQKRTIDELRAKLAHLEQEVETVGDQDLFKKYKELMKQKEDLEMKMAQTQFTTDANQKSYDLMKQSYEQLKQGQLELVEMNKKLIMGHQDETKRLTDELAIATEKLETKSKKLDRYVAVAKTFDAQIEMFDQFQQKSINEMNMLQSQVTLFQDLFQKEKLEKEECIARMRPSQRPLHDSVKKQMMAQQQMMQQQQQQLDSNRDWEPKVNAFDASATKYQSLGSQTDLNLLSYRGQQKDEEAGLTQTLSKNLSFGQPFHGDSYNFRSGQSSKREDNFGSGLGSGRVNPHLMNLPMQILNENLSDTDKNDVVKYDNRCIRSGSNECTSNFARQYNKNNPPLPRKQDSSVGGRPHSGARALDEQDNSYIESNFDNSTSMIQNYQTPSEAPTVKDRWNSRHRSSSQNGHQHRMTEYHHQGYGINNPNISSDVIEHRNNQGHLATSGNNSRDGRRSMQPRANTAMSEADRIAQSALNNSRKLLYMQEEMRQGSLTSQKLVHGTPQTELPGGVASSQQSHQKTKMIPMSPKDYYCRLKEMQRRLDRARNDIQGNVSRSQSRSKSPAAANIATHRSNTGEQQQRRQRSHRAEQERQQHDSVQAPSIEMIHQQNQHSNNIHPSNQSALMNQSACNTGYSTAAPVMSSTAAAQAIVKNSAASYNQPSPGTNIVGLQDQAHDMTSGMINSHQQIADTSSLMITNMSQISSAPGPNTTSQTHPYQTVQPSTKQQPARPFSQSSTRGKSWEHRRDFPRPQQSSKTSQYQHAAKQQRNSLVQAASKGHLSSGSGQQPPQASTPVPTTNAKNPQQAIFYTSLYNGVQPLYNK